MSNGFFRSVWSTMTNEDFTNDIAFKATIDLLFCLPLKRSFAEINLCRFMGFHPHDGDPV